MDQATIPERQTLACPECGGRMWIKGSRFGLFYGCENFPGCKGTHSAHADGRPMGVPGDGPTKIARHKAHRDFDRLWLGADRLYTTVHGRNRARAKKTIIRTARRRAYEWLAIQLGLGFDDCHIGNFDLETCQRVVEVSKGMKPKDIRTWAKARQGKADG